MFLKVGNHTAVPNPYSRPCPGLTLLLNPGKQDWVLVPSPFRIREVK